MTPERFYSVVQERCDKIKSVLASKAKEYATEGDRFHNFNEGAREVKLPREKYLECLMQKHVTSVRDIINNWQKNTVSDSVLDEKIGDFINYLILLEGVLKEDLFPF